MTIATLEPKPIAEPAAVQPAHTPAFFRVHAIMRQGTAASIPAVWERYSTLEAARAAVRAMYSNDRVLRVMIVTGDVPPRFVEWVER